MDLPLLKAIKSVGPLSNRNPPKGSTSTIATMIEVEMEDGSRAILPLSQAAVEVLAEELSRWLRAHGSP